MMAKKRFFVTGTDTEIGKTFATCALMEALKARGKRVFGLKPVAAGAECDSEGVWKNEDAVALMKHASESLPYAQVNPVLLKAALAPHVAAAQEGKRLQVSRIAGYCQGAFMLPHDVALIEGAGGWLVPLNERETLADLAAALSAGVILVVGLRLGCINHTLLTAESIGRRGLPLRGWIANAGLGVAMDEQAATVQALRERLAAPCLGVLPYSSEGPASSDVQAALDIAPLLGA